MKLKAELAGRQHEVSLERQGQSVSAEIDGRHYELDLSDSQSGSYLLLEGTRVHDCRIETRSAPSDNYVVHVGTKSYEIRLVDPRRLNTAQDSLAHQHGAAEIVASMPGKVVRVLVEVGTKVEAGQGIVVVEAMKMQNEMKAPRDGTVLSLKAEAEATVNAGDVLAVIE
jgi:biotin carboxyl carrier protein